jgi:pimeloyl-ACP methyl ester carboxylesterase
VPTAAERDSRSPAPHAVVPFRFDGRFQPGAGRSSDVPADFGLADDANGLAALIEVLALGPAHVAGLSWGGTVAQDVAPPPGAGSRPSRTPLGRAGGDRPRRYRPGMDWTTFAVALMGFLSTIGAVVLTQRHERRERRAREGREDANKIGPLLTAALETIDDADPDNLLAIASRNRDAALQELVALRERIAESMRAVREMSLMHPAAGVRVQSADALRSLVAFFNALGGATLTGAWLDQVDSYGDYREMIRRRRGEAKGAVEALAEAVRLTIG